jgi:glycosyltransferase involved in cell wall biosynthesis
LLHDPELLLALPGLGRKNVVWDVHEDTAASVTLKPWLPRALRPVVRFAFQRTERTAERRFHLILAEYAYQSRFAEPHLVVPNVTTVPPSVPYPDEPRVVYAGNITRARGAEEMVKAARIITSHTDGRVRVEIFGKAAADVAPILKDAVDDGVIAWKGFVPNDQVMKRIEGSIAGFSLLHDEQNYRVSLPTKVTDYIAHGVPVVTTPLPYAREVVEEGKCGIVVPFDDPHAAANAVLDLWDDPDRRHAMGNAGHELALKSYNWTDHAAEFVDEMTRVAKAASKTTQST